jgi:hypothetical protein
MKKPGLREFRKYLKELEEDELRQELEKLYRQLPLVKEYYQFELSQDHAGLVISYKQKIERHYFPTSGRQPKRPKAAKMRDLINQFRQLSPFTYDVADLLLYQTETMVRFANDRGYISRGFSQTLVSRYKEALVLITKEDHKADFSSRAQKIMQEARKLRRWNTYDDLVELYIEHINKGATSNN